MYGWGCCVVFVTVLSITFPGVHSILGSGNRDVQKEIDSLTEKLSSFERPNQIVVDSFIQQIQIYCPNKTIDESIYTDIAACMDKNFNNTELQEDIRDAIPNGKLDEVFHNMCKKWPVAKKCMKQIIDAIDDCWAKGDKVTLVMDSMVNFFCGEKKDGEKIALFFADGGMRCLESYGREVQQCFEDDFKNEIEEHSSSQQLPSEDDICRSLKQLHGCSSKGLKKCDDSTPENLVTSMLKQVSKAIGCQAIHDPPAKQTSGAAFVSMASLLVLPCVAIATIFKISV